MPVAVGSADLARVQRRLQPASGPLPTPCLLFQGSRTAAGYGRLHIGGKHGTVQHAHLVVYRVLRGDPPEGWHVHHRCHVAACANIDHLVAVPPRLHVRLSGSAAGANAAKTACPQGHRYTKENTERDKLGRRRCRTCHRDRERARYAARRTLRPADAVS